MAVPALTNTDEIAKKFAESLRTIAKLQGFSEQTVTLAEVGVVLKTAAGRTKVTDPALVTRKAMRLAYRRARYTVYGSDVLNSNKGATEPGVASINLGIKGAYGVVWYKTRPEKRRANNTGPKHFQRVFNSNFTRTGWHINDPDWVTAEKLVGIFKALLPEERARGEKSVGLGRQVWVQMADDLGIRLEEVKGGGTLSAAGIAKARAAIASTGKAYRNGAGTGEYKADESFFAKLVCTYPYWQKLKFDVTILSVMQGRAQYFQQNVNREVFASHAATVKAYPWMKAYLN